METAPTIYYLFATATWRTESNILQILSSHPTYTN